jgi:phage terminase large subunit-like protein
MSWDLSCSDWETRLREGRSLVPDLPLDFVAGDRAVKVFQKLRLSDVPSTPMLGEAGGEWFFDIVRALFGSIDPVTRERYIQEIFVLVAKKNSKTTNGALLMLTALLLNQRPRAEFIFTAPVQETAETAFAAAAGAIALDPVLEAKFHVRDHLKTIVHRETKATLELVTFEPAIVTGRKVAGALIDELHVLGKQPRAAKALLQLRGGMQPFPEAFLFTITTQSDDPPTGVFKDELKRARAVRDGERHGDTLLPVLYEFPKSMQADKAKPWRDPKNWHMVTPNAGRSISIDRLIRACEAEEAKSEEALKIWASQHLNIEIGVAMNSDSWGGALFWEENGDDSIAALHDLLERCEVVTVGIDGGGLDDLLGVSVVGREKASDNSEDVERQRWLSWSRAFAHPIVLERRKSEASRFDQFAKEGDLYMVKAIGDDVEAVADIVEICEEAELLDKIGVDAAGIGAIVDAIVARGVAMDRIVGISQGWRLNSAIKTTERKLAGGTLKHGGRPLMAWSVGNCRTEARGNAITITKQISGSAKIDPVLSLFNAVTLMALNPEAKTKKFQLFSAGRMATR